jgi:hypothetical protein
MDKDIKKLIEALRDYTQADEDGVFVKVSRQACDEAAATLQAVFDPENQPSQFGTVLTE